MHSFPVMIYLRSHLCSVVRRRKVNGSGVVGVKIYAAKLVLVQFQAAQLSISFVILSAVFYAFKIKLLEDFLG